MATAKGSSPVPRNSQSLLDSSYRCAYCLTDLQKMRTPKILPCSHVFCSPCIIGHLSSRKSLTCPLCRTEHEKLVMGNLKELRVQKRKLKESDCGKCVEDDEQKKKPADVFCMDCQMILCKSHHQLFPAHYKRLQCIKHPARLVTYACGACFRVCCTDCLKQFTKLATECIPDADHAIYDLDELVPTLIDQLKELAEALWMKIDGILISEKNASLLLDDLNHSTDIMKEQLMKGQDPANVKEQLEILHQTRQSNNEKVKAYSSQLLNLRDDLNNLRNKLHHLITQQPYQTVMERFNITTAKCQTVLDCNVQKPDLKHLIVLSGTICNLLLQTSYGYPSSGRLFGRSITISCSSYMTMTPGASQKYMSSCTSVSWASAETLLCCSKSGFQVLNSNLELKLLMDKTPTLDAQEIPNQPGAYCYITKNGKSLFLCSTNLSRENSVTNHHKFLGTSIESSDRHSCYFSVSETNIALISKSSLSKKVKVLTTAGVHQFDIDLSLFGLENPRSVHFLSDGHLLVSDYQAGLVKITLESESREVWRNTDVKQCGGISISKQGVIFCADNNVNNNTALKLIAPSSGETITSGNLPPNCNCRSTILDISYSDANNLIAVALEDRVFMLSLTPRRC